MLVKFSVPTIHAIKVLGYIAHSEKKSVSIREIGETLDLSEANLKLIIRPLRVAGIVASIPGKYGGFSLGQPLESITLYHVVKAIEGESMFAGRDFKETLCEKIAELDGYVNHWLSEIKLADIC